MKSSCWTIILGYLPDSQFLTFWIDWPILICKTAALRFKIAKTHIVVHFISYDFDGIVMPRSRCFAHRHAMDRASSHCPNRQQMRFAYLRTVNSKSFRTSVFILEYPLGILEYPTPVTFLYPKFENITLLKLTFSHQEMDSYWSCLSPQSTGWKRDFCNFYNRVRRDILRKSWQEISPVQQGLSVCVQSGSAVLFKQSLKHITYVYIHK